jgi:DNA-binding NtrC family response regulator
MITATQTAKTAVQAMKLGAYDYFTKPFDVDEILITIKRIIENHRMQQDAAYVQSGELKAALGVGDIIGNSPQIHEVFRIIEEMQQCDTTVLVQGASGTGKELVAKAIHFNGLRKNGPFVAVNCAAIPRDLLESELFGHEKGAFSGAIALRKGKFELAANGTFFLDEISTLPLDMQAKLLRVLQENEFERVGGARAYPMTARIITSCNVDLRAAVDRDLFRRDLYYRINVVPIFLPPLTERQGDLALLANHFIRVFNQKYKRRFKGISPQAIEHMGKYSWPGNIRELQNVIERIIALNNDDMIYENLLPLEIVINFKDIIDHIGDDQETADVSLRDARREFEKRMLIAFMEKYEGNQAKISRILNVHRNTILNKMKEYNLEPREYKR